MGVIEYFENVLCLKEALFGLSHVFLSEMPVFVIKKTLKSI